MASYKNTTGKSIILTLLPCPECDRNWEFKFNDPESKQAKQFLRLCGLHLHKAHGVPKSKAIKYFKEYLCDGDIIRGVDGSGRNSVSQYGLGKDKDYSVGQIGDNLSKMSVRFKRELLHTYIRQDPSLMAYLMKE